jgi:DNA repair protein RecO
MKTSPIQVNGIIVAAFESGEKDKVLKVLGVSTGKVAVIAKGCRSSNKKQGRQPELFDYGSFILTPSTTSSLLTLHKETVLKTELNLLTRFDKMIAACFVLECADALTTEHHVEDGELVVFLQKVLAALAATESCRASLTCCFDAVVAVASHTGFSSSEFHPAATRRNMRNLVSTIQQQTGRELHSAGSIELLMLKLAPKTQTIETKLKRRPF